MNPSLFDLCPGWKTHMAAIGLVGLSIYQLSQNDVQSAVQSFMGALAAFGVRVAIQRNENAAVERHNAMLERQELLLKQLHHHN
jgi:hypothetical protein